MSVDPVVPISIPPIKCCSISLLSFTKNEQLASFEGPMLSFQWPILILRGPIPDPKMANQLEGGPLIMNGAKKWQNNVFESGLEPRSLLWPTFTLIA